jgi:hypothetical protein
MPSMSYRRRRRRDEASSRRLTRARARGGGTVARVTGGAQAAAAARILGTALGSTLPSPNPLNPPPYPYTHTQRCTSSTWSSLPASLLTPLHAARQATARADPDHRRRRARSTAVDPADPALASAQPDAVDAPGGALCALVGTDGLVVQDAAAAAVERHYRPQALLWPALCVRRLPDRRRGRALQEVVGRRLPRGRPNQGRVRPGRR